MENNAKLTNCILILMISYPKKINILGEINLKIYIDIFDFYHNSRIDCLHLKNTIQV